MPSTGANHSPPTATTGSLRVLFSQCRDVIERVRRNAARNGTSIRLTYHLQRLRQLLQRSEQLLDILVAAAGRPRRRQRALPADRQPVHPAGPRRVPAQQPGPSTGARIPN
jgi:site-specific recombinase